MKGVGRNGWELGSGVDVVEAQPGGSRGSWGARQGMASGEKCCQSGLCDLSKGLGASKSQWLSLL